MDPLDRFKSYIAGRGLRMTSERAAILDAVFDVHAHFTVAELIEHLAARGRSVGRSTIYRMMPHLVDAGLIKEASFCGCNEEQVYEHIYGHRHHDHLICERCGAVIEFEEPAIEILQEQVAAKYGFKLRRHFLDLRGVCPACQERIVEEALHP